MPPGRPRCQFRRRHSRAAVIVRMDADDHAVAVRDGYISITPLHYDMTDYKDLEILSDARKRLFK